VLSIWQILTYGEHVQPILRTTYAVHVVWLCLLVLDKSLPNVGHMECPDHMEDICRQHAVPHMTLKWRRSGYAIYITHMSGICFPYVRFRHMVNICSQYCKLHMLFTWCECGCGNLFLTWVCLMSGICQILTIWHAYAGNVVFLIWHWRYLQCGNPGEWHLNPYGDTSYTNTVWMPYVNVYRAKGTYGFQAYLDVGSLNYSLVRCDTRSVSLCIMPCVKADPCVHLWHLNAIFLCDNYTVCFINTSPKINPITRVLGHLETRISGFEKRRVTWVPGSANTRVCRGCAYCECLYECLCGPICLSSYLTTPP